MRLKNARQRPHYGLRKLSIGVASVLLSITFGLGTVADVHADVPEGNNPAQPIGNSPQQQEHQNVSDQLTNVTSDFKQSQQSGSYTPVENGNAIYPEASGALQGNYSFDVPDTVKSGDYFNITISNNLNIYGTHNPSDVRQLPDIKDKNDEIIAKYDLSNDVTGHSFRYNFTDYVDNHNDVFAKISIPLFIDPKAVPNDSRQNITTGIGNKETTNTINVQYTKFSDVVNYNWPDPSAAANGEAFITALDHNNKEMTSVIYANPTGNIMQSPWVKVENLNNSKVNYNNRDTRVTVYQLKSGYNPTQSFYIDPASVIDITGQVPIDFEDNKMYIQFPTDYGLNLNKYIIKYTTTYDDSSTDKIYTRTTNYAGDYPNNYMYWDNLDVTHDPSQSGGGTVQPTSPTTPQPTTPQPTTPQPTTPQPTSPTTPQPTSPTTPQPTSPTTPQPTSPTTPQPTSPTTPQPTSPTTPQPTSPTSPTQPTSLKTVNESAINLHVNKQLPQTGNQQSSVVKLVELGFVTLLGLSTSFVLMKKRR